MEESDPKKPRRSSANLQQVYKFVIQQYLAKTSKLETFLNACHTFNYPIPSEHTISKWLNKFENDRANMYKNVDECYFELLKQIDDVYLYFVSNLIERKMRQNKDNHLLTFKDVSKELKYESVEDEKIYEWFWKYRTTTDDKELINEMGQDNLDLIKRIVYKHSEQHHLLFKFEPDFEDYTEVVSLNPRYAFKKFDELKIGHLQAVDFYHGQAATLVITNDDKMPKTSSLNFDINPVDSSNLILAEKRIYEGIECYNFHLMTFDLRNGLCNISTEKLPWGRQLVSGKYHIVVNQEDTREFVIVSIRPGRHMTLFLGDFKLGRFITSHETYVRQNASFSCLKFQDKTLNGLQIIQREQREIAVAYWELEISENGMIGPNTVFEFELEENIERDNFEINCHVWADDICYTNLKDKFGSYNLYAFNASNQQCVLLNFTRGFQFDHLYLDKNLIGQNSIGVYRFGFQLDKLEHLAWFEIRRQAIKFKRALYDKAITRLPLESELQPFYIKP